MQRYAEMGPSGIDQVMRVEPRGIGLMPLDRRPVRDPGPFHHVSTQPGGTIYEKMGFTRHQTCQLPTSRPGRNRFLLFTSHPGCGVLLQQPEQTETPRKKSPCLLHVPMGLSLGFLDLLFVPSKSDSEIRTWAQGVALGSDPRKTDEEVSKVRWQGGREKRPVKGVLRRGELGGGDGVGVWDGNVAGLGCDDSYTNINIIKSIECLLFFFFF